MLFFLCYKTTMLLVCVARTFLFLIDNCFDENTKIICFIECAEDEAEAEAVSERLPN